MNTRTRARKPIASTAAKTAPASAAFASPALDRRPQRSHVVPGGHLLLDPGQTFVEVGPFLHVPGPSEQANELQLAEDALVVVELGVRTPLFLHQGDLRAEP